ncbi:MAG: hypothetical protein WDW36_008147 [Sanguina aurantia]
MDGHIPGAVYASLDRDLSDLSRQSEGLGRHPLPLETALSQALSRWGWQPGMRVTHVAVLDGGYAAWQAAQLPIEKGAAAKQASKPASLGYDAGQLSPDHPSPPQGTADVLLDARLAPRYRGDIEPMDRVAGHVPGALNRPFTDNLGSDGRFKPAAQLREEFAAVLGSTEPARVVHMLVPRRAGSGAFHEKRPDHH